MHSDVIAVRDALAGEEVQYATLEVRGEQARVAPAVAAHALLEALNGQLGEDWDIAWRLESAAPAVVACRLTLLGHGREGLGTGLDVAQARHAALTEAARAWGLLGPAYEAEAAWVEYDPDEGPNTSELGGEAPPPAASVPLPEPPRDPQLDKAKKHIDDLMDQLREQGRGKQASLVLVKYGGYGQTVDESRRVYAELKALLRT